MLRNEITLRRRVERQKREWQIKDKGIGYLRRQKTHVKKIKDEKKNR